MSLFRYQSDFPAVAVVLLVAAAQLFAFFAIDSHLVAFGCVALLFGIQVSSGAICHNHHHVNTFRVKWLNRVYEMVLYLQTGTSPYSWTIHHNIGHHRHYLNPHEDPAPWQHGDGRMMSRLYFDVVNAARIYPEIIKIGRDHPHVYSKFKRMFMLANLPLLALLLIDPVRALIVFVLPMMLLLVLLLDNTWGQHAGTGLDNHFEASRNVELKLYNITSWNLGFHTAHHMLPGLHWSKLPALHERIRDRIPPHLITRTLFLQWMPEKERRARQQESN
ncbi:MAG: fatty acid desaturase [Alcanivoracaceae bacterium]|nr:fatty acid desaturase [Alcanivoracaceae bacterium]